MQPQSPRFFGRSSYNPSSSSLGTAGYGTQKKSLFENKKLIIIIIAVAVFLISLFAIIGRLVLNSSEALNNVDLGEFEKRLNSYANYILFGEENDGRVGENIVWQSGSSYADEIFYSNERTRKEYIERLKEMQAELVEAFEYDEDLEYEDVYVDLHNYLATNDLIVEQYSKILDFGVVDYGDLLAECYEDGSCAGMKNRITNRSTAISDNYPEYVAEISELVSKVEEKYDDIRRGISDNQELDSQINELNRSVRMVIDQNTFRLISNCREMYDLVNGGNNE